MGVLDKVLQGFGATNKGQKVGVSGHRHRENVDWEWTRTTLVKFFVSNPNAIAWSSLAVGADQLFAEVAFAYGGGHVAVIPGGRDYVETFSDLDRDKYNVLHKRSKRTLKVGTEATAKNFKKAGERIVREVDLMIFIWDGEAARGEGGTAEIVAYAQLQNVKSIWLNPITRQQHRL